MRGRIWTLLVISLLLSGTLGLHLFDLQINGGTARTVRAAAEDQEGLRGRGTIFAIDRNGERIPLAITREYPSVYAAPRDVRDPEEITPMVAAVLQLPEETVRRALQKEGDPYEPLRARVSEETAQQIRGLALEGIYVGSGPGRLYPFGTLAAQIIGFVGPKEEIPGYEGRYGIERAYNATLANGNDVTLTIDRNVQAQSESILDSLVTRFSAAGGSVIVMDPNDGRIFAMANYPVFDPNRYHEFEFGRFLNPAVQFLYEPGSVMKVITMAAGIDSGAFSSSTTIRDTGSLTLNNRTIKNWDEKAYGTVTMTEVIERSINIGAAQAERLVGHDTFLSYLERFGVEEKTGVSLPGEVTGSLASLRNEARDINFATASFGQGIAVTPIGLIRAIAAIANNGMLVQPHIIEGGAAPPRRIIAPETARAVTTMMASAVEKAGVANIHRYAVAGKTGTAQIPDLVRGGYKDAFIHSYVGFAPAVNPRFIALIKLDQPQATLAGTTVVPAFRELAEFLLNYYRVPPNETQ